jgi:hypothetical protein
VHIAELNSILHEGGGGATKQGWGTINDSSSGEVCRGLEAAYLSEFLKPTALCSHGSAPRGTCCTAVSLAPRSVHFVILQKAPRFTRNHETVQRIQMVQQPHSFILQINPSFKLISAQRSGNLVLMSFCKYSLPPFAKTPSHHRKPPITPPPNKPLAQP